MVIQDVLYQNVTISQSTFLVLIFYIYVLSVHLISNFSGGMNRHR